MTSGPHDEPLHLEPGDERLLQMIRHAQRDLGADTRMPSEEAVLAFIEDRAGPGHLDEIRDALSRRPALAAWLAELVDACRALETDAVRRDFDRAQAPPLPPELLRRGREELAAARGLIPQPSIWKRAREWVLGGWAVVATATAALLLVSNLQQPVTVTPPPVTVPTYPSPQTPVPPIAQPTPPAPSYGLAFLSGEGVVLRSTTRSAEAPIDTIDFARPTRVLRFTVDPIEGPSENPDSGPVSVELVGPGKKVLVQTRAKISDFYGDGRVLLTSTDPFPPGRYALSMRGLWTGADSLAQPHHFYVRYRTTR